LVEQSARSDAQENPAFRQMFASPFIPGGTAEQMQWFNDRRHLDFTGAGVNRR
jgi:hypothetical protein